jgi:2-polyprenyl-3-methyl-5-hydroxy-6-metoxy-1,4-benzoquinol methylase
MNESLQDKSNGYEAAARQFMASRNPQIGTHTGREWSRGIARGSTILDLGCGHGVPISQVLIDEGFDMYGVDASPTLIAAFRERFPNAHAECAAVEDSEFFWRAFDGVVAVGLMFLLPPNVQATVIRKIGSSLNPAGKFLFTSPKEAATWRDILTGRESVSLGAERYLQILHTEGLLLVDEQSDERGNHYYLASKPHLRIHHKGKIGTMAAR